jgi:hypothetical protein
MGKVGLCMDALVKKLYRSFGRQNNGITKSMLALFGTTDERRS